MKPFAGVCANSVASSVKAVVPVPPGVTVTKSPWLTDEWYALNFAVATRSSAVSRCRSKPVTSVIVKRGFVG